MLAYLHDPRAESAVDMIGAISAAEAPLVRRLAPSDLAVLVQGETGSGKTTTLYATLTEIHTGQDKIIALRRAGRTPRYVWVSDFAHATLDGRTVCVAGAM